MEKKARILLIDDDADFVESTKIVLESKPYEVIVAVNGDEGDQRTDKRQRSTYYHCPTKAINKRFADSISNQRLGRFVKGVGDDDTSEPV